MRSCLLLLMLLVTGCDAWPTAFANRSESRVTFQYHLRGYDEWSGQWTVNGQTGMRLARASWMKDILGVRIIDGQHHYEWSATQIQALNRSYDAVQGKRGGGDWIVYLGSGKLGVSDDDSLPHVVTHDASNNPI